MRTFQRQEPPSLSHPPTRPTDSFGSGTTRCQETPGPESPTPPETWRRSCRSRCIRHHQRRTCRTNFWRELRGRWVRGTPPWNPRTRSCRTCSRRRRKTASGDRVWLRPSHQNHAGCYIKPGPHESCSERRSDLRCPRGATETLIGLGLIVGGVRWIHGPN